MVTPHENQKTFPSLRIIVQVLIPGENWSTSQFRTKGLPADVVLLSEAEELRLLPSALRHSACRSRVLKDTRDSKSLLAHQISLEKTTPDDNVSTLRLALMLLHMQVTASCGDYLRGCGGHALHDAVLIR